MAKQPDSRTGSTPRTDPVAFTVTNPAPALTAGQLRAAGYDVPAHIGDDEIPGSYAADTRRTDAEPFLVTDGSADHLVLHDKTPAEVAGEGQALTVAEHRAAGAEWAKDLPDNDIPGPRTVTTLGTTPAQQAKKDSKGTEAEAIGPRAQASTLDVTPTQAAGTPQPEE